MQAIHHVADYTREEFSLGEAKSSSSEFHRLIESPAITRRTVNTSWGRNFNWTRFWLTSSLSRSSSTPSHRLQNARGEGKEMLVSCSWPAVSCRAENCTVAILCKLPRHQDNVWIADLNPTRSSGWQGFIRIADFILVYHMVERDRLHALPAHPGERRRIKLLRAGQDIAKSESTTLSGAVVGIPIIIHGVGEDS